MKTITVRELRARAARVWRELPEDREFVVTSNGRPVAVLLAADAEAIEETLVAFRRARAEIAVLKAQLRSTKAGRDALPPADIEKEIAAVRTRRAR